MPALTNFPYEQLVNLERVHKRGVVHRDLKPANIFLDRTGNLVLGDFGLAAFTEELEGPPMDFVGTAEYIAREIWQGENYSCASDVWAYGAVLFELAVGRVSSLISSRFSNANWLL